MLRRVAVLVSGLTLVFFLACSNSGSDQAQAPGQPPEGQPPATAETPAQNPAQAVPAETAPVQAQPESKPPNRPRTAQTPPPAKTPVTAPPVQAPPAQAPPAAAGGATETRPASALPVVDAPTLPPPAPKPIVIPSGTRFEVRLVDAVSSKENKTGDSFKATLDQDLEVDGKVVVPRGSTVMGKLLEVQQPGRVEGRAAMSMTLTSIVVDKSSYPIQTNTLMFEAEKSTKEDATKIGVGAGIGALIGAIAGGGKGAAIGAAVGGGAGTATVLATKGKDVQFSPEERFSFLLRSDLEITR